MAMLPQPVRFPARALRPTAVLNPPVVVDVRAKEPIAVLLTPLVLAFSAQLPTAVLLSPVVFAVRAHTPTAVLPEEVFANRALHPKAVLLLIVQPNTVPATVGVAGETGTAGVVQVRPVGQAAQATRA